MENQKSERLGSLDVLRGFDLFCLVFFQPVLISLGQAMNVPWMDAICYQFDHVNWEGFAFWDIIMPLFMFMAGVSMPFAFSNHLRKQSKGQLYKRIIKRVILLWIFGMMCQGNLLSFDPSHVYFYSNTLQSIAIGYLFSAIFLLHFNQQTQIIISTCLLLIYWALLTFVKVRGYGGGDFTPEYNLAEYVDENVLGRFRYDAIAIFGNYQYTWLISSLNFIVTVMTGVFAGQILKKNQPKLKKILYLSIIGVSMIVVGLLWSLQMPIIKHIWTSSMTLFSSGICFLLMALFYYLVDYKNYGKYLNWLKIYGMNSILAYMIAEIVNFNSVVESVFHGTQQFFGDYYAPFVKLGSVTILFFILLFMYRNKKFLKI